MERINVAVVVENFVVGNHEFVITRDNYGDYWGFNKATTKPFKVINGIQGHHGKSLNETLAYCYSEARSKDELDQQAIRNNNIVELMKLMSIIEDANKLYPHLK